MRNPLSGGRGWTGPVLLSLVVSFLFLALALPLVASESCSMLGGKCRDACVRNEQAEAGDFEDCGPKQECCVVQQEAPTRCCVLSFDARDFGPSNCRAAEGGSCPSGSASPVPCEKLTLCRERP